jgi:hypothetical protein
MTFLEPNSDDFGLHETTVVGVLRATRKVNVADDGEFLEFPP